MGDIQILTIALAAVPNMLAVLVGILINNSRLSDTNARIGDTNASIRELRGHMDTRFNDVDRRFDDEALCCDAALPVVLDPRGDGEGNRPLEVGRRGHDEGVRTTQLEHALLQVRASELADDLAGAVVAIGNAPTALFRLLDLLDAGAPKPAAILGIPVGFVGAAEAKEALAADQRGVPFLIVRGRMGGSAMMAAAVNALVRSGL